MNDDNDGNHADSDDVVQTLLKQPREAPRALFQDPAPKPDTTRLLRLLQPPVPSCVSPSPKQSPNRCDTLESHAPQVRGRANRADRELPLLGRRLHVREAPGEPYQTVMRREI